jgi:hypothetical protein
MSGAEFEKFVAKVFAENGHHTEVTKASGDYGVDLVLNGEIAVQAKFYGAVVGPSAVQEVVAGRAVYGCSQAWVVTNSTFTAAAVTLAQANGVRLIASEELRWLAENPDNSTDHGARYRAHLAELEAKKLAERLSAAAEAGAKFDAALAKAKADTEALRLQQMAAWKNARDAEIAAGRTFSAYEQARIEQAGRILENAGLAPPKSESSAPTEQSTMPQGRTFTDVLARERDKREAASAQQAELGNDGPTGPPAPGPPAGWYSDPTAESRVRWWDGQQWTSAVD